MGKGRPIPLSAFGRLLAWNRTYEAGPPIKPWATRPRTSAIITDSILMQLERRSCPISPDTIRPVVYHRYP